MRAGTLCPRRVGALLLALAGFGCTRDPHHVMPTAAELIHRVPRPSVEQHNELAEQLEQGREIAIVDCSDCHRMHWPAEYRSSEWPRILRDMGQRASLSPGEVDSLTFYLQAVSDLVREAEPVPTSGHSLADPTTRRR